MKHKQKMTDETIYIIQRTNDYWTKAKKEAALKRWE